ncbi:MAG: hypothetical protein ABIF10_04485 [Candidatus Woesearchaeota archaeon]
MSKQLETTVRKLLQQQRTKKSADRQQYEADKRFCQLYDSAMAMIRAGHVMPRGSTYFARIVEQPRNYVNNATIVQRLEDNYSKLANVIEKYRNDCRKELVEKLKYGAR